MYPKKKKFQNNEVQKVNLSDAGTYSTILPQIKSIQKSPRKVITKNMGEDIRTKTGPNTGRHIGGFMSAQGMYHDGLIRQGESSSYKRSRKELEFIKQNNQQ